LGPKGRKAAQRLNMSPESVARIAVKSMFARKTEIITGFINQLGAGLAWLLPKALVERTAATMYE
jgi:short-subunit dehydrogenase